MTPPRRWYLTTPIYYASGDPHIGHAYTTILADVLARFARQIGTTVFFLTGTDEHGPKIQDEAERRGIQPLELCDLMADGFSAAWTKLDISHDRFIRTTEDEHKAVVTAFLQRLWDRGQIYKAAYTGWYCVYEERFWTEKDLGPDNTCPDCGRGVDRVEETNYFFKMSEYQEALIAHIEQNPDWIVPEERPAPFLGTHAASRLRLARRRPHCVRVGRRAGKLPYGVRCDRRDTAHRRTGLRRLVGLMVAL